MLEYLLPVHSLHETAIIAGMLFVYSMSPKPDVCSLQSPTRSDRAREVFMIRNISSAWETIGLSATPFPKINFLESDPAGQTA
jgi:hypothetical protein